MEKYKFVNSDNIKKYKDKLVLLDRQKQIATWSHCKILKVLEITDEQVKIKYEHTDFTGEKTKLVATFKDLGHSYYVEGDCILGVKKELKLSELMKNV